MSTLTRVQIYQKNNPDKFNLLRTCSLCNVTSKNIYMHRKSKQHIIKVSCDKCLVNYIRTGQRTVCQDCLNVD